MTTSSPAGRSSHACPACGGPLRAYYARVPGSSDPDDVEALARCYTYPCRYGWE